MSTIKEESYSPSNLDTVAEYGIVDTKEQLCLRDVKPLDPNLLITSSSQHEGCNASWARSTDHDLYPVTVKTENENANEKGCNVANHNASGLSPLISLHSGESDEFKCSTSNNNITSSTTIDQHKPISPVRKTIYTEHCIKKEPCTPSNHFPIPNVDTIVIHSIIDDVVSGNADLENDIAGKPLYSNETPSMYSDCKRVKKEPTEELLAEQQCGSKKPTLEEMQISEIMSGNLIPKVIIQKLKLNFDWTKNGCNISGKLFNTKKTVKNIDLVTSSPRQKGSFTCRICLRNFCFYSAVKKHMIQKHPLSRDLCAFVQNEYKDSDNDSQLVWFCPRNCKYFTSEYKALSEHLVTCQKPDLLPLPIREDNVDIGNNLGPLEFDKDYDGDTNAESLMVHTQQTGQTSNIPGQTVEQEMIDIPTRQLCDRDFSSNHLLVCQVKDGHKEQNESTHTGDKPYICSHCDKRFNHRGHLKGHMRIHTGEKPYKCSLCDKSFSVISNLNRHIRIHTGEKPYKCSLCDKSFSDGSNLNIHMRKHPGEKPYKCSYCDKSFRYTSDLNVHMRIHKKEKPFKCSHCNKIFTQSSALNGHIRTHTGDKPFKCSHCDKSFRISSNLTKHMRTHTGDKPFKCSHCNKTFSESGALNVHMRTHTGEKPFKCSHCNKTFSQSGALNNHMRTHTGEKPFKCSHCNKTFRRRDVLNYHVRTHTGEKPFKCSHCTKTFSQSGALTDHIRKHTGEKPFKCSHCNKTFRRNDVLNDHIRKHTGEKPYICSHCGKSFGNSSNLNKHMKTHTGETIQR